MNVDEQASNKVKQKPFRHFRKATSRTFRSLGLLPTKSKKFDNDNRGKSDSSVDSAGSSSTSSKDRKTLFSQGISSIMGRSTRQSSGTSNASDQNNSARSRDDQLPTLAESRVYHDSYIPQGVGEDRRPSSGSTGSSRIKRRSTLKADTLQLGMNQESADFLDFVLKTRGIDWLRSFRRLDPRFQILKFFNDVAQEGADKIETKGLRPELVSPILRAFQRSSVFTVWRPTSFEAMKKMMLGQGTGKGLDIKGKSAKKGKLSSYVPFMQIHEEKDKKLIRTLPKDGKIRVFYKKRNPRDLAIKALEPIAEEMMKAVAEAKEVLDRDETDEESREVAMGQLLWDMDDPTIRPINDYDPRCFGIELPERLFWEGFCMRQDISRPPGTEYETGRPSQPSFQDMNFGAIRNKGKAKDEPVAVVWQYTDPYSPPNEPDPDPMLPQTLLMAYEEHGRVLPVVSDFDCFLVGTRGVTYTNPVPPEQVGLLNWSITQTEAILNNPKNDVSWTGRWLEVLKKKKTVTIPMPRFGYGDSKSYSIMECAVGRLVESGAVRHGAECFNYGFPQELDDELLVISDTFDIVPWRYVGVPELQKILSQKIDEGFTFPLNPKWILCDEGWKDVYDKLCASQKSNVQNSLRCWFPPESGLRERIEQIHEKHPKGFRMKVEASADVDESMIEGTTAMDLAELELARAESLERAKKKLRLNMIWVHLLNEVRAKNAKKVELGESYAHLLKNMRAIEQEAINEGIELSQTSVIRDGEEAGFLNSDGEDNISLGETYQQIVRDMHSIEEEAVHEGIRLSGSVIENGGETNGLPLTGGHENEADATKYLNGEGTENSLHLSDLASSANSADSNKSVDKNGRLSPAGDDTDGGAPCDKDNGNLDVGGKGTTTLSGGDCDDNVDTSDQEKSCNVPCDEEGAGISPNDAGGDGITYDDDGTEDAGNYVDTDEKNVRISPGDDDKGEGVKVVSPLEIQEEEDESINGKVTGTRPDSVGGDTIIPSPDTKEDEDTDKTSPVASDLEDKGSNAND